jgi:hypothetical protein
MKWQLIIAGIIALPILALFGGIGFLAYQIGENWDARTTDTLIAGMVATCSGGAVVAAMLLALFIGIPFAIRMFGEAGASRRAWREPAALPPFEPSVGRRPTMIDGNWQSLPAPPTTPPWGITGGGNSRLLPPPQQDNRFRLAKQEQEWAGNGQDGL